MQVKTSVITATFFFSMASFAVVLPAQSAELTDVQLIEDTGASERVEAAALLRVLSQEATSAACHMVHDINPAESRQLMIEAKTKFNILLDALQYGDPKMHIVGAEPRRKTIAKIEALREQWKPMYEAAAELLEDPHSEDALKSMKQNNEAILEAASILTSDIEGDYSNPAELLQSDVWMIEFAARQEMLTQMMAKLSCEIWAGNRSDERIAYLRKTMETYDLTLKALLHGMPAISLKPAPTPEIKAALTSSVKSWGKIKSQLDAVLASEDVPQALKEKLFQDLNVAMYEMEHIEHLYVLFSKHGLKAQSDPA